MKNKLYSLSVFAVLLIPFVAPREGSSIATVGRATEGNVISAASFMPVFDWDMSDLDVRDAQNRPIRDAQSTQTLTELFINNLFGLAVVNNLHAIDEIWNELTAFSRLFHGLIFNVVYALNQSIPKAWLPSTKRFVHNVHNLWIVLSVGLCFCSLQLAPLFIKPSNQRLILRC